MQTLNVDLGERSYPIYIGDGLLTRPELLLPGLEQKKAAVVTNTTVAKLYLDPLTAVLVNQGVEVIRHVLPSRFNWPLFCVALALMAAPVAQLAQELWRHRTLKFSSVTVQEIET